MSEIRAAEGLGSRRRILLADDYPLMLERVRTLLQSTFDVVGVAHDGHEMIGEAMRLNPDIIVADVSMPGLDGIEAAHRLREMGATATIVFLTIHESPEFVEVSCLSWKWRKRSSVKIAERTYEKGKKALQRRGEGGHLEAAPFGQGSGVGP